MRQDPFIDEVKHDEDDPKPKQHLFSKHLGRHIKPHRKLFYKPKSIWGWIEQIIQVVFIAVLGSFLVLLAVGALKGI